MRTQNPKYIKLLSLFIPFILLWSTNTEAYEHYGLEDKGIFKHFRSEIRAPKSKLLITTFNGFDFSDEGNSRYIKGWEIHLGTELPFYSGSNKKIHYKGLKKNQFAFAFTFPVSFHMIEALNEVKGLSSSPILNVDYRFGIEFKALWRKSHNNIYGIRFGAGHESTHLGDEYILQMQENPNFKRINVSYEFIDLAVYWKYFTAGREFKNRWEFEFLLGITGIVPWKDKFYSCDNATCSVSDDSSEYRDLTNITYSKNRIDAIYFNFQLTIPSFGNLHKCLDSLGWVRSWHFFLSIETRLRTVYDYDKGNTEYTTSNPASLYDQANEEIGLGVNILFGITKGFARKNKNDIKFTKLKGNFDYYFRYYQGVNPHGQFRNHKTYRLFGAGFLVNF